MVFFECLGNVRLGFGFWLGVVVVFSWLCSTRVFYFYFILGAFALFIAATLLGPSHLRVSPLRRRAERGGSRCRAPVGAGLPVTTWWYGSKKLTSWRS